MNNYTLISAEVLVPMAIKAKKDNEFFDILALVDYNNNKVHFPFEPELDNSNLPEQILANTDRQIPIDDIEIPKEFFDEINKNRYNYGNEIQ